MVKVIVLQAAGTNCDKETAYAFSQHTEEIDLVHINELKSGRKKLSAYHILAIPGGFTYGDDIAAGKILANELKCNLKEDLKKFIKKGKLIIGICNGFQVLVKAGILPDVKSLTQKATLVLNDSDKFEDRWVYLKKNPSSKCIWTKNIDKLIQLPIAHAEGKFIMDKKDLAALKKNEQIVFQYVNTKGNLAGYPFNPNGSMESIAAITDKTGLVLGIMPHPERFIRKYQHPHWQRLKKKKLKGDGNLIFKNGIDYVKNNLIKNR